jgi:DNA polymerase
VLFVGTEINGVDSRELLNKMIQAMKLSPHEYKILEDLDKEEINNQILAERPAVVITLGAQAANFLLGGQERLSKIHGNFFPRPISDNFHTQIVPLFHPGFLLINPGMKKSAWMDMQKVMDFIGKSIA